MNKSGKQSVSRSWLGALEATAHVEAVPHRTLAVRLAEIATERGDAPALLGDDATLTFAALSARVDAVAAWARAEDVPPGSCIGLDMANGADYVAIWLGLSAAGLVVALLNTNLHGAALVHCARSADCRRFVADAEGAAALRAAGLEKDGPIHAPRDLVATGSGIDATARHRPTLDDTALLIYTSGTTGLPKALASATGGS